MKRSILFVLLLSVLLALTEVKSVAQLWKMRRYELVAGIGPSFFFGDVGGFSQSENWLGFKDITFKQTRVDLNLNFKYRISQHFNARASLTYALFHATDIRGSNEGRDFEASISGFEPALIGEYYFLKNKSETSYLFTRGKGTRSRSILKALDFFAFTGIGGLAYSIKPNDNLEQTGLDPKGFVPIIPVGLGSTLIYSPDINFGLEVGGRYAFSDYIDGYTSQYSSSNDVYYFFNFTFTYKLKTGPRGFPSFR
jgi:hypothetical protein